MSVHQTSVYAGVIMSGALGVYCPNFWLEKHFFLFGGAGVLLAFIIFLRVKPVADLTPKLDSAAQKQFIKQSFSAIFRSPSALLLCFAFFHGVRQCGLYYLDAYFLHEKFNLSVAQAGFDSMFYHYIFAFSGVLLGGFLSDKFALKHNKYRLIVQMLGLLLAAPFIFGMGQSETKTETYFYLAAFGFSWFLRSQYLRHSLCGR